MPENTGIRSLELIATAAASFSVAAVTFVFGTGKFSKTQENHGDRIKKLEMRMSDDHGTPLLITVPECVKTQQACQKLILAELGHLTKALKDREKQVDNHFTNLYNELKEITRRG